MARRVTGPKRTGSSRFLPRYVSSFRSQHGTVRYYFRRGGCPKRYFTAELGSEAFRHEYQEFLNLDVPPQAKAKRAFAQGSLDDLLCRYYSVPERMGPTLITQTKVRAVLESFREGRGDRPVRLVTFEAIDKIIAKKAIKTGTGNQTRGGIHAARKLRKELVRLFDFAVKIGYCSTNPAKLAEKVRTPAGHSNKGFHAWSEEEIDIYRAYHPLGSRERLAMELLLWTDQRRSDVVHMGLSQVVNGRLRITQAKGGVELWMPLAPQLLEAIEAIPSNEQHPDHFLLTKARKPFSKESFGNFFKKACIAAGLPHCSAHGLRKATLRRMAELELANKSMKAVSGQTRDDTLAHYIRSADQRKLADAAITTLARWEKSERGTEIEDGYRYSEDG